MYVDNDGNQITRHVCPKNCYDACGILAYTRNGKLQKVTGDPKHGYTNGKLCSKGYSYIRKVYHPDRLKYPMRQLTRGSGQWERISWDEAIDIICKKILELKKRFGSTLPLCLNKYSGNLGLLHYSAEGLFNSLGPTTQAIGSPCWSAGLDAQFFDMGNNYNSDPKEMEKAKLIILWGVNPAWTAIHSIPFIHNAKDNGAKVIVIDPIYTDTARKADWYIQVKPGGDGALALAIAKVILETNKADKEFLSQYTLGWEEFAAYLRTISLDELATQCGQNIDLIREIAEVITTNSPSYIWVGFGLQRHINGGQNIRAIDALGAITGNLGKPGGGVHFANLSLQKLPKNIFLKTNFSNRFLNINNFAEDLTMVEDPPVKLLWIASRNLIKRDSDISKLIRALKNIELIVTVELFMTETAEYSDLVLPTTTFFEEIDLVPSYWHHWLAINEQAISPYFEAKSDLEIAQLISKTLNRYQPGSCSFPEQKKPEDFLNTAFDKKTYNLLGIKHWSTLKEGPLKTNLPECAWENKEFETPSGKFEFYSKEAEVRNNTALPINKKGLNPDHKYPYWLLTPHSQYGINSQFYNIDWIANLDAEPLVYVHPDTASAKGLTSGQLVRIYNDLGEIIIKAKVSNAAPPDTLLCYQGGKANQTVNFNKLIKGLSNDMGQVSTGSRGSAFYDVFVDFKVL